MISHEDRCIGALLGTACGDALGSPVEFKNADWIQRHFSVLRDFVGTPKRQLGCFTDDTEMTIALTESLVIHRDIYPKHLADEYCRKYQAEPRRGYGPSASQCLNIISMGGDYRFTSSAVTPGGSHGNGGAMRIAPVGLAFRSCHSQRLRQCVVEAIMPTHTHAEGIDGAFIQALAIAWLSTHENDHSDMMVAELADLASTAKMQLCLHAIGLALYERRSINEVLQSVCTPNQFGTHFQIHACEAVACSLWAFFTSPTEPEQCVIRAVNMGGDTDTIGAMTGALCGALHGHEWIPKRWLNNLENDPGLGRDHIIDIAKQLALLDLQ